MTKVLKGIDNFGSESIDDAFQRLETLVRALHIPDFNVFAALVQNATRHILSTYSEDYNIYDDSYTLFFAGHFLNDINRKADILEFPRYIFAIAEAISLIESKKQELNNVSIFEEIAEKFKKLMKLFQDAVYYAQHYQKEIRYSALCPVTIAYESVRQFKEDIVKMLLAILPEDSKQEARDRNAGETTQPTPETEQNQASSSPKILGDTFTIWGCEINWRVCWDKFKKLTVVKRLRVFFSSWFRKSV